MLENEGATPDEIKAPEVVEEQPKSMDETIRDTLRSLKDKGAEIEPSTPEVEEKPAKVRDEKGKFAPKVEAETTPEVAPIEPVAETPEAPEFTAPNTWKKGAAEKLRSADPEIRAEVERREADFHKGIEGYKQKAQFADTIQRAVEPHLQTLQSLGVSADQAFSQLLQADSMLRYSPPEQRAAHFVELARSYGVDLNQVTNMPESDQRLYMLQSENQRLKQEQQNRETQAKQQADMALNSDIQAFATDPNHSHFESVKGHMAALLQAGQAQDLASAYEQAVWANPQTRAALIAQQQTEARAKANQAAQAAKQAASVNTRARPSMPVTQPIGSMDDTIRQTLRRLTNA